MAVIDKYAVLRVAFQAAGVIHMHAVFLRGQVGSINFGTLRSRLDAMRQSYEASVQPLLNLGTAGQINPQISTFFVGSAGTPLPANPYAQFQLVGTELSDLYVAYDVVFDALTPIEFDPNTGHTEAEIPTAQLSTLADELDAVIAAAAPLA